MLVLDSITKRYGDHTALAGVSLTLQRGEFFGLLGPNGAGKSTTMALIAGLKEPDSGQITLDGQRLGPNRLDLRSRLGLVPQSIALYEDLTAVENLRIFGRLYGLRGKELEERIEEVLVAVQLSDRRKDLVKTYSGGMQRRLNIVAAILHRPALLLCDEPTVGVDPQSRNAIFELLLSLNREGLTVIYSTHYMEEATRLCSRIAIVDHGRVLALGTLNELLAHLSSHDALHLTRVNLSPTDQAALEGYGQLTCRGESQILTLHPNVRYSEVFATAERIGIPSTSFQLSRPNLEDVFLHLTGKSLRDL